MVLKYLLVASLVTVAGCSTFWRGKPATSSQSAASGSTSSQPQQSTASRTSWMSTKYSDLGGKAPPMSPSRKINEQSCTTGGVDLTAGNLRCK